MTELRPCIWRRQEKRPCHPEQYFSVHCTVSKLVKTPSKIELGNIYTASAISGSRDSCAEQNSYEQELHGELLGRIVAMWVRECYVVDDR